MNQESKPPARDTDLTVVLSTGEKNVFRKKCVKAGVHCSTQARSLINAWNPAQAPAPANVKAPRPPREYPSNGHLARSLPNRASRGGAPRPPRL